MHVVLEDVLSKFHDDVELGGAVVTTGGGEALQRDVDKLENWASTNHMKYNKNKGLILHLGRGNHARTHNLGDGTLESSPSETAWAPGQHQIERESAVCPGSQGGQLSH